MAAVTTWLLKKNKMKFILVTISPWTEKIIKHVCKPVSSMKPVYQQEVKPDFLDKESVYVRKHSPYFFFFCANRWLHSVPPVPFSLVSFFFFKRKKILGSNFFVNVWKKNIIRLQSFHWSAAALSLMTPCSRMNIDWTRARRGFRSAHLSLHDQRWASLWPTLY